MSTYRRFLLVFWTCAVSLSGALADPPAPAGPASGKVLILDTDRIFEGDIELVGEQYRIRRGTAETWLPANKGLRLCSSWEDAYDFMKLRANLSDPDERLRLARWCQTNSLPVQALAEVTAVLELRPNHPAAKQLQTILKGTLPEPRSIGMAAPRPSAPHAPSVIIDLSSETQIMFTTKVQPILMNACINCHHGGRGGAFQLHRPFEGGGHRGTTQKNLAAVIDQIRMDKPGSSPLLFKALSAHYPAGQPPLSGRDAPAFRTLQNWVQLLIANNPHVVENFGKQPTTTAGPRLIPFDPAVAAQQLIVAPSSPQPEDLKAAGKFDVPVELKSPEPKKNNQGGQFDVPLQLPLPGNSAQKVEQVSVSSVVKTPVANAPGSSGNAAGSSGNAAGSSGNAAGSSASAAGLPSNASKATPAPGPGPKKSAPAFDVPIELTPADAVKVSEEKFASYVPSTVPAPGSVPPPVMQTKAQTSDQSFASATVPAVAVSQAQGTDNLFAHRPEVPEGVQAGVPGDPFDPAEFNRHMHPQR